MLTTTASSSPLSGGPTDTQNHGPGIVFGFGALPTADVPDAVRLLLACLQP